MLTASVIGSLYGVLAVICIKSSVLTLLGTGIVSAIMTLISFGKNKTVFSFFGQCILLWGCGALLGGVMSVLMGSGNPIFIKEDGTASYAAYYVLTFVLAVMFVRFLTPKHDRVNAEVSFEIHGETFVFTALADSGNLVKDPFNGYPVIITSASVLGKNITDHILRAKDLSSTENFTIQANIRIRVIPHKTMNGEGLLYGFLPELIFVNGKRKNAVVALDETADKNGYGGYDGIVPMCLCN